MNDTINCKRDFCVMLSGHLIKSVWHFPVSSKKSGFINLLFNGNILIEIHVIFNPVDYWFFQNGPSDVNHAVLAVGFGVEHRDDNAVEFWDVKNSWGTSWGDQEPKLISCLTVT